MLGRRFFRNLLLAFPLAFLLWYGVDAPYSRLLAAGAKRVVTVLVRPQVRTFPRPGKPLTLDEGAYIEQAFREAEKIPKVDFNVMVLVALLLATPGLGWWRRLGLLAAGLPFLFLTHLVALAFVFMMHYTQELQRFSVRYPGAWWYLLGQYVFARMGLYFFPFFLWVALTYRHLFPRRDAA